MLIEAVNLHIILRSLPAWGVRVEISGAGMDYCDLGTSLPAWGVRVEIEEFRPYRDPSASLPAWGVRVEISCTQRAGRARGGHSPHGECGLKLHTLAEDAQHRGHSPHGECGLKYVDLR